MILKELLNFLLVWISLNTNYETSKFDFPINVVKPGVIQQMVCGGKCPVVAYFAEDEGIFIPEMNLKNICNQSILLHEVIHALQINSNLNHAFKEKEAYELQNKFPSMTSKGANGALVFGGATANPDDWISLFNGLSTKSDATTFLQKYGL